MKYSVIIAMFVLSFRLSLASDNPSITRIFTVNYSKASNYDADAQMCDDSYYNAVEILIPTRPKLDIKSITKECSGMKFKHIDNVFINGTDYIRLRSDDAWESCSIVIEKPLAEDDKKASKFTIELSDSC